jgi:hypothetical protein
MQLGYAAIPLFGWKDIFPTSIESFLWRVSTLVLLGSVLVPWLVEIVTWRIPATQRKPKDQTHHFDAISLPSRPTKRGVLGWLRNNTPENDPNLDVPISALLPVTLGGGKLLLGSRIYACGRLRECESSTPKCVRNGKLGHLLASFLNFKHRMAEGELFRYMYISRYPILKM